MDLLGLLADLHRASAHGITLTPTTLDADTPAVVDHTTRAILIADDLTLHDWIEAVAGGLAVLLPSAVVPVPLGSTAVAPSPDTAAAAEVAPSRRHLHAL